LIEKTPHLDWLVLTKRIHLVRKQLPKGYEFPKNVWLGATVEHQDAVGMVLKLTLFHGHLTVMERGVRDAKPKPPYPAEFRQQIIELARAGRTPAQLSREFGPSAQSITNWIAQDGRDRGKPLPGKEGLTSEREELVRLRRRLRQVEQERDILAKATAWFAGKSEKTSTPSTNS
jgi:transposase